MQGLGRLGALLGAGSGLAWPRKMVRTWLGDEKRLGIEVWRRPVAWILVSRPKGRLPWMAHRRRRWRKVRAGLAGVATSSCHQVRQA